MEEWYSGKYDRAFKEVMLKECNRDLLIMLLEHILKVKVLELEVINNEKILGNLHIKGQRLDLNLNTNIGKINVEVNSNDNIYTHKKNFSYLADTYSHSILVGHNYDNTLYIQINLSYNMNDNNENIGIYKMKNQNNKVYVENFIIYNVNMDYYMNLWYNNNMDEVNSNMILVMLGLDKDELTKLSKKDKVVQRYMNELNNVNENPEFREYMSYEKEKELYWNSMNRDAKEEGFNEGLEQGIEQGIEQGKSQGSEAKEKEVIDKLISKGMSKEEISSMLDIDISKIKDIIDA